MFVSAAKVAIVEALRATFDFAYPGDINFRSIDIEYPEREETWPGLLVQFRPSDITWTGINPDEIAEIDGDPDYDWNKIRKGQFNGAIDLTILALTSQERDRLWDNVIQLVLMGDMHTATDDFLNTINNHDLIALTVQSASIASVGDSIGPGVPWDPQAISYEATIRLQCTGQFHADIFEEKLVSITNVEVLPYRGDEPVPGEGDGLGDWQ